MLIRPIRFEDLDQFLALTQLAGIGMLSLPPDREALYQKISLSVDSFAGRPPEPRGETFLFVMEEPETKRIVGTCGIVSHVGLTRPFYSYKLSTVVQANSELNIYSQQQVLHLVNDYTGSTEICSLLLHPDYRRDGLGRFLSRCRYLLIAQYPHLFDHTVIAEIRGINDDKGDAPFYDHLARHFFKMSFIEADTACALKGNQMIADLMPRYPIYVNLLPEAAQEVIGKPYHASEAAYLLLLREGFTYEGYVDVFDAGPTIQCERSHIRAVRQSRKARIGRIATHIENDNLFIIANTNLEQFYICRDQLVTEDDESVTISETTARLLQVEPGHVIRYTPT